MTSPRLRVLGVVAAVAVAGCRTNPDDGTWVLPASVHEAQPRVQQPVLALALAEPQTVTALWTPGSERLRLEHVLASVDANFPLFTVARQKQFLAAAKELEALGAFDLKLSAKAQWNLEGFYENHSAGVSLEQATGLHGLRLRGGYRLGRGNFDPTFDGKRITNHGGEVGLGVAVPLLRGGSFDAARRDVLVAGHERDMAASELADLELQVRAQAASAYWSWVAAGRKRLIAEALLELAEVRERGLEEALANGAIAEIEVLDNRRLVVERRAFVISARRGIERAALALSLFLRTAQGRPLLPPAASSIDLPPGVEPMPAALELDLEQALQQRPDLHNLVQEQARERVKLRYAENTLLPQLDLSLDASQDLDRRRPSQTKGDFELVGGLKFEFPLQNRKARGKVLASEARLAQVGEKLELARDKAELEVRDAFSALRAAFEREQQARLGADLAERVAGAERQRFALGDSTVLKLNLREAYAAEAALKLISARRDYWTAVARYTTSAGASPRGPGV